ncbi:hypothetical protein BG000_000465 [Podila horticola]|nr:hypothetical protein BG000_000465 [Podila horticola]
MSQPDQVSQPNQAQANLPQQQQQMPPQPYPTGQQMPPQPYPPGQKMPPQPYPQGQYQPQYAQHPPPNMAYQRNEALIAQYQKEIAENQVDWSDVLWFVCLGPFALICCIPKYNRQHMAQTNLALELAKV